jgi:hypothetical protein
VTGSPSDDPRPARTPDDLAEPPTAEPASEAETVPEVEPAVGPTPQPSPAVQPDTPEAASTVSATAASDPAEPEVRVADVVDPSSVRHAPRYSRFILTGVVGGAVAALLIALLTPPSQYARSDLFWILFLGLGLLGGIVGATLAVVLDRRSLVRRDARTAGRRTPPGA